MSSSATSEAAQFSTDLMAANRNTLLPPAVFALLRCAAFSLMELKMRVASFLIVAAGLSTMFLGIALMSVVLSTTFQSAVHSTHNMDQHSPL
jgi:hypothetical protein